MTTIRSLQKLCTSLASQVNCKTLCSSTQSIGTQHRRQTMATAAHSSQVVAQEFKYFLVLDFEATCIRERRIEPQEIIEFPVLKVNGKSFETEATFHSYVQPIINKVSEFCTELTGISQDMVDGQPTLEETLKKFDDWMQQEGLLEPKCKSIFVTCGDWDLKTMLPNQCKYFKLKTPNYFDKWINIKKPYAAVTGTFPKGMLPMQHYLGIEHQGRHHSGIDDCKNIAKILQALAGKGYKFVATGSTTPDSLTGVKVTRGSRHGRAYRDSDS